MEVEGNEKNTKTNQKIKKILQKFLEPEFKIKDHVYLNRFFTRLVGEDDKADTKPNPPDKQLNDQFCQWIIFASKLWERNKVNPPSMILSFALNLTGQLSCDEHIFVNLNGKNVYESLVGLAQRNSNRDPKVSHGMVTLLCSFLEHKSGVQWLMATTHWMDVIELGLICHTPYIRTKIYQFVTTLLEKTINFNKNFGVNLVGILLKPINNVCRSLPNIKDSPNAQIQNEELIKTLKPTLEFISEVTSTILKTFNAKVLQLFLEQNVPDLIEQVLLISQNEDLSFELLKVKFVFLFYKLCVKLKGVKTVTHDSLAISDIQIMFELFKNEMEKNNVKCVIKLSGYAQDLYCSLAPRMPLCVRKGEVIEFQNQMILIQLSPILILGLNILCNQTKQPEYLFINDDFRKDFFLKLLKKAAIRNLEICYKWKKSLEVKPDLMEDAIFSLEYLVTIKHLLNKELAATMFASLVYSLKDWLNILRKFVNFVWTSRATQFICTLVDTIVDFVESFDLTWNDSIETIHVMDLAVDFLQYPTWCEKIIVIKGLKLLNTAISKYMSADMVLLIYNVQDSTVSQSGSLLYGKCHDGCWEVRDCALEVVYTLSLKANAKFPALTNILLEAELPQLVVHMALNDVEFTVRTTAIRCLQELIQIPDIWNILIGVDSFLENMLHVLENDSEAIVRKEAAKLISKIYEHQSFPEELLLRLYDVTTHAAIGDSYWEVTYNALDFWLQSWRIYLTNQGMIDKRFPSHTFSMEQKKIVTLNEAEVRKRVIKVLNQLSQIGCLYVIKCAVLDSNIEVSKKCTYIIRRLRTLFTTYKIPSDENVDLNDSSISSTGQRDSQYEQLFEPVSPASSTTMTAFSPADLGNPYSPQFDNFQNFDPPSPYPVPLSASQDFNQTTSSNSSSNSQDTHSPGPSNHISPHSGQSPQSNQISHSPNALLGCISYHEKAPVQITNHNHIHYDSMANQNNSNISTFEMFDVDMLGPDDGNCENRQIQCAVNSKGNDPGTRENVLNDCLNISHMTLPQGVYNSSNQVTKGTTKLKTKTYLSPSQCVKFVYNEAETYAIERDQWQNSSHEFDSLLDQILGEL